MNFTKQGVLLSIILLAGCASTEVKKEQSKIPTMNDAQLKSLLVGNTMVGSENDGTKWTIIFKGEGNIEGTSGSDRDKGTYNIKNNMVCRIWNNWSGGKKRCWSIHKNVNDSYQALVSGSSKSFSFNMK